MIVKSNYSTIGWIHFSLPIVGERVYFLKVQIEIHHEKIYETHETGPKKHENPRKSMK